MKKLNEFEYIYVICPANNKTGGTELLHQLADSLVRLGKHATVAYYLEGSSKTSNPTPVAFKKYKFASCFVSQVRDSEENLIIFPEVAIGMQRKFKKSKKAVWWLSVDNYLVAKDLKYRLKNYGLLSLLKHLVNNDYIKENDIQSIDFHFYQSYFAKSYITQKGISEKSMHYLSDYINDVYLNNVSNVKKEDIVLYNPKKGYEFTQRIMKSCNDINFVPIINMTNSEVVQILRKSKVYIDFGNHPGKDRIPREAAISGCCVITNKRGSAGFTKDVPIPDEYKFEDLNTNIPAILKKINFCINNYQVASTDFENYRSKIRVEKKIFFDDVSNMFAKA